MCIRDSMQQAKCLSPKAVFFACTTGNWTTKNSVQVALEENILRFKLIFLRRGNTPPQTLLLVGMGHPLRTPHPFGAFDASIVVPRALDAFATPFYAYRHFFFHVERWLPLHMTYWSVAEKRQILSSWLTANHAFLQFDVFCKVTVSQVSSMQAYEWNLQIKLILKWRSFRHNS